jgi:hypothetical protein
MDNFIIDELPPERTGPTGPRTPAGKAKSSGNSLKHGCRSEKTVLPHEDPAEFEATVQHWFTQYEPATPAAITLVENLVRAHWQLKRNQKRLDENRMGAPRQRARLDRRTAQTLHALHPLPHHCRA